MKWRTARQWQERCPSDWCAAVYRLDCVSGTYKENMQMPEFVLFDCRCQSNAIKYGNIFWVTMRPFYFEGIKLLIVSTHSIHTDKKLQLLIPPLYLSKSHLEFVLLEQINDSLNVAAHELYLHVCVVSNWRIWMLFWYSVTNLLFFKNCGLWTSNSPNDSDGGTIGRARQQSENAWLLIMLDASMTLPVLCLQDSRAFVSPSKLYRLNLTDSWAQIIVVIEECVKNIRHLIICSMFVFVAHIINWMTPPPRLLINKQSFVPISASLIQIFQLTAFFQNVFGQYEQK